MIIWKLKDCPRCRGDLYLDKDPDYDFFCYTCFQCGYQDDLRAITEDDKPYINLFFRGPGIENYNCKDLKKTSITR